jgi:hypothetical protein
MKDWLKKIVEALRALKVVPEDKMPEVDTALSGLKLEEQAQNIDPSKINDPAMKQVVEGLQGQLNAMTQQYKAVMDALTAERTDREKAVKTQQDQIKADREAKVKAAVDKAIKEGKYPEAKRESLMKSANADLESFEEMVKDLPVDKHFKAEDKGQGDKGAAGEVKIKSPIENANASILSKVKEFAQVTE